MWLASIFLFAGLYIAVQEALESTVIAAMVQHETLTTSPEVLSTVNDLAKLLASAGVGLIWTVVAPTFAFALAAAFLLTGTFLMLCARS
jgi:hypothetical protein